AESIRIIRTAIDNGITFLDNCWDYHDGRSDVRMGEGTARRLPRQSIPDDQDRRSQPEDCDAPDRSIAPEARD
ncbi:MAG: hypothetical protein LUQ13_05275, partial [Methanomicrobiales archaeon]|nr:hypothetical protein [Methanomicrobiales archaeon]